MEDKRNILLETAIKLFGTNGFWNTSTAQIAKEAGVATGTLFNYFSSKDVLISEVLVQLKGQLTHSMVSEVKADASVREQLYSVWTNASAWAIEHPDRFILMEQLSSSAQITQEAQETMELEYSFVTDILKKGQQTGVIVKMDENYLLQIMMQMGKATLQSLITSDMNEKQRKQAISQGFNVYWKGISAR